MKPLLISTVSCFLYSVACILHPHIIIIGSGISGLNFALRAAEKNKRVLLITKKHIAQSSTNFAQGGIAAVLSKLDDFKKHVRDTLIAGSFHNNKKAVEYMVRHGPAAIARLIELGVPFATHRGKLMLGREGGHGERRIAFVGDFTGSAIERALVSKVKKNPLITLCEHTFAVDLLVKNGRCYGVRSLKDKKFEDIYGDAIVLATGGIGRLYSRTTNPEISTGDGLAMAARAGCEFRDLEFIQFHPTAFSQKGKCRFLISEAVRGEGAYLRNSDGKRFINELSPRDVVARAIFEEEKTGPVFLDLRHKNAQLMKTRFPQIYQTLKSYGINMSKDLIPVSPAAHYICGGVKVNLRGETNIKNLYAFGEVTCTGVHGANRLASNSLLEALVFSDRVLTAKIGHEAQKRPSFSLPKWQPLTKAHLQKIKRLRENLQNIMWENVGIVRSAKSLRNALEALSDLKNEFGKIPIYNREALELKNMIQSAELITKAALARRKSLGCHYRI